MGANGKGKGKEDGTGSAPEPGSGDGQARNGKARRAGAEVAPPEEAAGAKTESGAPSAETGSPAEQAPPASTTEASAPDLPAARPKAGGDGAPGSHRGEAAPAHGDAPRGAAWAHPFVRFEQRWTWLESRLLTFVLVWQ